MKRIILFSVVVFLFVFLLWPTTKYNYDQIPSACSGAGDLVISTGDPPDCSIKPSETIGALGGGMWYVGKAIGRTDWSQQTQGEGFSKRYILNDVDTASYFYLYRAGLFGLLIALLSGGTVYLFEHRKHKKA